MDPSKPPINPSLPIESNPVESEEAVQASHMKRASIKNARKNIFFLTLAIIALLILLSLFGVAGLQKLTEIAIKEREDPNANKQNQTRIILPPSLEADFTATNSADIALAGMVAEGDEIKLYVNGALADKTKVAEGEFAFEDVTLKEGANSLKAKVVLDGKESNFSDELKITYYGEPPQLEISSPADGRTFRSDNNPILVSGKTNQEARVTVSGHRAIMEQDGNFEYSLNLTHGDNDIVIIATDAAGNTTEKHVKAILE